MLKMRLQRAPLKESENRTILEEYNRLTSASIPMDEFAHWVRDSPAGPAWHAILETEERRIVGHTSVFPLRTNFETGTLLPAKSEYSFLHEDFRKEKIQGYENAGKPAFIILLDQLFQHCQEQGWGPIFASTNERNQVFTRKVGLRPVEFPLWECLLVLRPGDASRLTPNLTKWQRWSLFSAGIAHSTIWSLAAWLPSSTNGICEVPVDSNGFPSEHTRLSFFEDAESLRWRYLDGQYVRFDMTSAAGEYVIAKRGSGTRFLRVCQWKLDTTGCSRVLKVLINQARQDHALGVRWAVYDGEPSSAKLVRQMKQAGFLCARRTRTVMVHKKGEQYLNPALWDMNDSLFSFDP